MANDIRAIQQYTLEPDIYIIHFEKNATCWEHVGVGLKEEQQMIKTEEKIGIKPNWKTIFSLSFEHPACSVNTHVCNALDKYINVSLNIF